ncbi:MAG: hypothetical protein ACI392_04655 [Paludibacteraceae bacterium]
MKRNFIFALALIGCCACSNNARILSGDYSYKTSGTAIVITDNTDTTTIQLTDRIGQLNVVDLQANDKDSVLLIFNEMGGSVTTVRARTSSDSIYLTPYVLRQSITTGGTSGTYEITVSGTGIRYDDLIVLQQTYDGRLDDDKKTATLHSDNIITVANRN